MPEQINLGGMKVDVEFKDIKNIHLSVNPPSGHVRISAPARMKLDTVRIYAISKLDWIRRQQKKLLEQERETPREFLDGESHYLWGKRYLLKMVEGDRPPLVEKKHSHLLLHVRPSASDNKKLDVMAAWYRQQLKAAVPLIIEKWAPVMDVSVEKIFVQQMKTKWGSCNPHTRTIRLNTELAKKPPECLEYIVVHELAHLLEPTHNARFVALMDRFMPHWLHRRDQLSQLPVRHEDWQH
jgi:predicted metal-dependent hydrolase